MNDGTCPICKEDYERSTRKAFILLCGHSACSKCINFYKEAGRELECGKCCKYTQSANIEIQDAYKKMGLKITLLQVNPKKMNLKSMLEKKIKGKNFLY